MKTPGALDADRVRAAVLRRCGILAGRLSRIVPTSIWVRMQENVCRTGRLDYPHADLRLCVNSWVEHDVRLKSCAKEPETIDWIERTFAPGDVLYDIGANVGTYSLVTFARWQGKVRVFAFEPGFATFPQLCRNIALNGAGDTVVPLQLALSDTTSLLPFHYQNVLSGGALHSLGPARDQHGRTFTPALTLPTPGFALGQLVEWLALPWPTHMKIDVDGTEQKILRGARPLLERRELRSLLVEYSERPGEQDAISRYLAEFELYPAPLRGGMVMYERRAGRAGATANLHG